MTISEKRGTIFYQIKEVLHDWDINWKKINDVKDPHEKTITFYIHLWSDYDSNDVEAALEEVCENWDMDSWWDDEDDDVYVLECDYRHTALL